MKRTGWIKGMGAGFGLLALTGCITLTPDAETTRLEAQEGVVEGDVKALQEWRQEVRLEQESQAREIEQLRKQIVALESAMREQQQTMDARFRNLDESREQDKKFIIEELTRKLVALQGAMVPPAPPAAPAKSGYEHVVKAGETLSDISKAYKVGVDAIIKANSLRNANSIKVGQKLFIPD